MLYAIAQSYMLLGTILLNQVLKSMQKSPTTKNSHQLESLIPFRAPNAARAPAVVPESPNTLIVRNQIMSRKRRLHP